MWRRRRAHAAMATAIAACLASGACTPSVPDYAIILRQIPDGLTAAAVLALPDDYPGPESGSPRATLYRVDGPVTVGGVDVPTGLVGVFDFVSIGEKPPSYYDDIGPDNLHGYLGSTNADRQPLIASRTLSEDQLAAIATNIHAFTDRPTVTVLATVERSPVPRIGTIVAPSHKPGYAMSYTSESDDPYQRSVLIARFEGNQSTIHVLRWWFGAKDRTLSFGDGGFEVSVPAYYVNDDALVPDASYEIWHEKGLITVVRSVDAALSRSGDGMPLLDRPDTGTWSDLEKLRVPAHSTGR